MKPRLRQDPTYPDTRDEAALRAEAARCRRLAEGLNDTKSKTSLLSYADELDRAADRARATGHTPG